MNVNLI